MKNIVLFDSESWATLNPEEYVKEYLDINERSENEFENRDQLLYEVKEWLRENVEWDWRDLLEMARKIDGPCVLTGYFMAWNGKREGGRIFSSLENAIQNSIMDDSHPIFSITREGVLILDETHHDAPCSGNHYEIKLLSKKGEAWYEAHKDMDRKTICEHLQLKGLTKRIPLKTFNVEISQFKED